MKSNRTSTRTVGQSTPGAFQRWDLLATAALAFGVLILYLPSLGHDFIWDDIAFILKNPLVTAPDGIWKIWFSAEQADWWPLNYSLFWAQWQAWGHRPELFHLTSVLLHAFCVGVLFRTLRALRVPGPLFIAALFAVHPVNVEAVSWIFQAKTTLSTALGLLAVLLQVKFLRSGSRLAYGWSVALFGAALLAKSSVITMVICFPLVELIWNRKFTRGTLIRGLPYLALALAAGGLSLFFNYHFSMGQESVRPEKLLSRIAGSGWVFWFYIYRALLPLPSVFSYPRWSVDAARLLSWVPLVGAAVGATALFTLRNRIPRSVALGCAYFAVLIFPVLGFVEFYYQRYSLVADHYAYTALPGLLTAIIAAFWVVQPRSGRGRTLRNISATLLIAILAVLTVGEQRKFADLETLWRDTVARNPRSFLAQNNLAGIYFERGEYRKALPHYLEALRSQPGDYMVEHNVGMSYYSLGNYQSAVQYLSQAAQRRPNHLNYLDLGRAQTALGEFDSAMASFRRSLELGGGDDVRLETGIALAGEGRYREAIDEYRKIQSPSEKAAAYNNIGLAFQAAGEMDSALVAFRSAVSENPLSAKAHVNLANAYAAAQENESALSHYQQAIKAEPTYVKAWYNGAIVLERLGRTEEANRYMQRAAALDPSAFQR